MITIPLHKFRNHTYNSLYAYLLETKDSEFEITILRKHKLKSEQDSENYFNIHWEFLIAAWAGFKLHEVSKSFSYSVPTVYKREPFSFRIIIDDPGPFVKLLLLLIKVYDPKDRCDEMDEFYATGSQYYADHFEQRCKLSCFGLFNVADLQLLSHTHGLDYVNEQKTRL